MAWLTEVYHSIFVREKAESTKGFGTFVGVFVPSLLMLFGVIIFLRLGWVVGQVGLVSALLIISMSALVALLTALSMSSIATNIEVGKGGVYYILSRSLGLEVGSAIGLPLYIKQTLSIAFCFVGFAESLHDIIPSISITTIGVCSLVLFTALACGSLKGALKIQVVIFISIIASLVSLFAGGELTPVHPDTFTPQPLQSIGFWAMFAIFFPAMTGLESSVSLSGDLKNPCKSLPLGTISALITSYIIYVAIAFFLVHYVPLDRLVQDPLIMQDVALVPSLIVLGIWGATLSSALGGLLAAPRTLQAIAEDGVVSRFFAKTYGKESEPRIATAVTFLIALVAIYFGSVNIIAPILSMICLICYAVLNFAAGFETLMENPSWRPRFRLHWTIPMLGAALSIMTMLMIDAGSSIIASICIVAIYLIVRARAVTSSWEDIQHGIWLFLSRFAIYRLAHEDGGSKCWRPHFLVFSSKPEEHSNHLLGFSQAISQNKGFLTMASVVTEPLQSEEEKRNLQKTIGQRLKEQKIQAIVRIKHSDKVEKGIHSMIETYGLGPLIPNTIVFGGIFRGQSSIDFAKLVDLSYQRHCNVVILSDSNRSQAGPKKEIHVWWDDRNESNTELMLVLAYMLQRNREWRKSRIALKGITPTEWMRKEKMSQFSAYAQQKRFSFDSEVFVSHDTDRELIKHVSQNAGLVFLSLRSLQKGESMEGYASYLESMTALSNELGSSALVLSSEHTPLETIMK